MADYLQGYRTAYEKGVIHRDMSVGNILINGLPQDTQGNRGFIIDLDHAKLMEVILPDGPSAVSLLVVSMVRGRVVTMFPGHCAIHVWGIVASSALRDVFGSNYAST